MIIYRDILTGDEIVSDAYPIKDAPCDGLWEVDLQQITIGGETFDTGANASAEEAEEGVEDTTKKVLDVVYSFKLSEFPRPSKKEAQGSYKKYAKAVVEKLTSTGKTEQADLFKKTAPAAMKHIFSDWDNYDVYLGESADPESPSTWVLVNYREDGVTPYATIWKHAFEEYKV